MDESWPWWLQAILGAAATEVPWTEVLTGAGVGPDAARAKLDHNFKEYVKQKMTEGNKKNEACLDWTDPELVRLWLIAKRARLGTAENPPPDFWRGQGPRCQ